MNLLEQLERDLEVESKRTPGKWHIGQTHDDDVHGYAEIADEHLDSIMHVFNRQDEGFVCHAANTYRPRIETLIRYVKALERVREYGANKPEWGLMLSDIDAILEGKEHEE